MKHRELVQQKFSCWYDSLPYGEPAYQETFEAGFEAARAYLAAPEQEPVTFDITIDEDEALAFLRDMVAQEDGDLTPVRLLVGGGHSGYGLYIASADYPEEGAILVHSMDPQPTTPEPVNQMLLEALKELDAMPDYTSSWLKARAAIAAAEQAPQPTELNYEELLGAIARGWCTPINERKVMDSDLAIAIAEEVVKYLAAQKWTK